jgi:hypothetical protein
MNPRRRKLNFIREILDRSQKLADWPTPQKKTTSFELEREEKKKSNLKKKLLIRTRRKKVNESRYYYLIEEAGRGW